MKRIRCCLHIWAYRLCPRRNLIQQDVDHWKEVFQWGGDYPTVIRRLLCEKPEFRNLFYYRLGVMRGLTKILKVILPPLDSLYIWTTKIGGGLFIQHGFATVIAAKELGEHCTVNQQVTLGYIGDHAPCIGNNVTVTCGAKVLGGIEVGDNVKVGANCVVVKSVPANVTVVGVPAYIVRRNGKKVHETL